MDAGYFVDIVAVVYRGEIFVPPQQKGGISAIFGRYNCPIEKETLQ
jgi:hypothetical protein